MYEKVVIYHYATAEPLRGSAVSSPGFLVRSHHLEVFPQRGSQRRAQVSHLHQLLVPDVHCGGPSGCSSHGEGSRQVSGKPPFHLEGGYAVMSLRYDWPPKRGTSVGLAIGYPAKRV